MKLSCQNPSTIMRRWGLGVAVLTGLCLLIFSLTSSNHIETLVQIKQTAVNFLGGSQSPSKPSFDIDPYPFLGPVAWSAMHARMQAEFTMNGAVPAMDVFYDSYLAGETLPVWTTETINQMVGLVQAKSTEFGTYGKQAILDVISAIEAYPVIGKTVLVVGSVNPWAEAIIIASGAEQVYTVDFNKPVCSDSRIITMDIAELDASTMTYDAVLSFSSLEHDGLGRYGDPMHPYGDVERVKRIKTLTKKGGLFFLAVPTGKDHLVFNAHRIYGRKRLALLFEGWEVLGIYDDELYTESVWDSPYTCTNTSEPCPQPVHVLRLL